MISVCRQEIVIELPANFFGKIGDLVLMGIPSKMMSADTDSTKEFNLIEELFYRL